MVGHDGLPMLGVVASSIKGFLEMAENLPKEPNFSAD